jgi:hypothetical protein
MRSRFRYPLGRAGRRDFPRRRHARRELRAVDLPFTFRRIAAASPRVVTRTRTAPAPRLELVLAPRFELREAGPPPLVMPPAPPASPPPPRVRETLVLRERLERTAERAERLSTRVDAAARPAPPALAPPVPAAAPAPVPPPPPAAMVLQTAGAPQPPASALADDPHAAPGAPGPAPAPAPAKLEIGALTDDVMRTLDRRIAAERERRGRV